MVSTRINTIEEKPGEFRSCGYFITIVGSGFFSSRFTVQAG